MIFFQTLAALAILSVLFFKFAVKIFRNDYPTPVKYAVPWTTAVTLLILCLFLIVAPVLSKIVAAPLNQRLPDLDAEYAAQAENTTNNKIDDKLQNATKEEKRQDQNVEKNDAENATPSNSKQENDRAVEIIPPNENGTQDVSSNAKDKSEEEIEVVEISNATKDDATSTVIELDIPDTHEETPRLDAPGANPRIATQHPMARLLIRAKKTEHFHFVVALFLVSVVIFAPLVEEFVFRVVIQGFFEKRAGLGRPRGAEAPSLVESYGRELIRSRIALVCVTQAVIFAVLHIGAPESPENYVPLNTTLAAMVGSIALAIITLAFGYALLIRCGAKPGDLGLGETFSLQGERLRVESARLGKEWFRGVCLQLYATPILLFVNAFLNNLFPSVIVAPIPIFLFAIYEGYVYIKTRSYPTVVGMHMTLNFVSFVLLYGSVVMDLI